MRAVAVALLTLVGAETATRGAARADDTVVWHTDTDTQVSYGDPEDGDRFSLSCASGRSMEASFPDTDIIEAKGSKSLSVEGLGAKQTVPFTTPEGEGGWLAIPIAPDSLILTTLLTGQSLTFRRGAHAYTVPRARGMELIRALAIRCFTGQTIKAAIPDAESGDLMRRNDQAAAECRYGTQSARATRTACAQRDATNTKLVRLGWCFGRDESFGKAYRWHRCTPE